MVIETSERRETEGQRLASRPLVAAALADELWDGLLCVERWAHGEGIELAPSIKRRMSDIRAKIKAMEGEAPLSWVYREVEEAKAETRPPVIRRNRKGWSPEAKAAAAERLRRRHAEGKMSRARKKE